MLEAGSKFDLTNGMTLQVYGGIGGTFYNQGNLGADVQLADSAFNAGWLHITSDLPQDRFKTTAGLDLKANDHWDVRLEYSGEFADHFQSDTGALKVSYKF
jgi:outer membrane autotransporter protein